MANNCTTNYMIHGGKDDVESFVEQFSTAIATSRSLQTVLESLNIDTSSFACEGVIRSSLEAGDVMRSMSGDYYVEITIDTPSSPCIKAIEALLKQTSPYCVYFFITWNKTDDLFFTNDVAKEFYDYDYFTSCSCDDENHSDFRAIEGDARFWNEIDFEDTMSGLLDISGMGVTPLIDKTREINEKWKSENSSDYIYAHAIKRGETQDIEEDYIDTTDLEDETDADGEDNTIPDSLTDHFDNLIVTEESLDNPMSYPDSVNSSPLEESIEEVSGGNQNAEDDIAVPIVNTLRSFSTRHLKNISSCDTFEGVPYTSVATVGVNVDYTSIQQAVDDMPEGSIIYVESGIYKEDLVINKKITITGLIEHNTNIAEYPVVVLSKDATVEVNCDCTIRQLFFTNQELPDLDQVIDIIDKEEEYVTIEKDVKDTALLTVNANANIYGCFFVFGSGAGIKVESSRAYINDCFVFANAKSGIVLSEANDSSIKRCRIAYNGEDGIYIFESKAITVNDSYMRNQKEDGLAVDNGSSVSVYNCVIYYNDEKGINYQGDVSIKASQTKLLGNGNDKYDDKIMLENCETSI